jgi:hypothetical protein
LSNRNAKLSSFRTEDVRIDYPNYTQSSWNEQQNKNDEIIVLILFIEAKDKYLSSGEGICLHHPSGRKAAAGIPLQPTINIPFLIELDTRVDRYLTVI